MEIGVALNEHICLSLARALGLPAAFSEVQRFGDQVAIVVKRYDRADTTDLASATAAEAAARATADSSNAGGTLSQACAIVSQVVNG
jgi:hypothetical protein